MLIDNDQFYLGWQVGITYESARPEGNGLPRMLCLLDEMANAGMNLLSLMMASYAYFDPAHDGLAWPVKNSRLECLRDTACRIAYSKNGCKRLWRMEPRGYTGVVLSEITAQGLRPAGRVAVKDNALELDIAPGQAFLVELEK